MQRYETRSTIMTSNRPLEDWGKLIGDVPAATAILDRFLHHAEVIAITGKSYRLRNQARRNKGHKDPIDNEKDENGKAWPTLNPLPGAGTVKYREINGIGWV